MYTILVLNIYRIMLQASSAM